MIPAHKKTPYAALVFVDALPESPNAVLHAAEAAESANEVAHPAHDTVQPNHDASLATRTFPP